MLPRITPNKLLLYDEFFYSELRSNKRNQYVKQSLLTLIKHFLLLLWLCVLAFFCSGSFGCARTG